MPEAHETRKAKITVLAIVEFFVVRWHYTPELFSSTNVRKCDQKYVREALVVDSDVDTVLLPLGRRSIVYLVDRHALISVVRVRHYH